MRTAHLIISLTVLIFTSTSLAGLSPLRKSTETYEEASRRARIHNSSYSVQIETIRQTPERYKKPLTELDISGIPELSSLEELKLQFEYIRDTRFLKTNELEFARRISWLYPDDGCYIRAELAAIYLKERGYVPPKKIFVFGNLNARTTNSLQGSVSWWYHVAATYRVQGTVYVYDPAIDPFTPLTLQRWHEAVGGTKTFAQYTVCSTETVDPDSDCFKPRNYGKAYAENEQMYFLNLEWLRLEDLKRDPIAELGDSPPWRR